MVFVIKLGINSLNIVVINKVIELQPIRSVSAHFVKTLYRMGYFKIISVVMT